MPVNNPSRSAIPLVLALTLSPLAQADEGFIGDAHFNVLNRNFYFGQDYRNGDFGINPNNGHQQSYRREWGHGVIASFASGFTPGVVGFGLDVQGLGAIKLDGGNGRVGNGVVVPGIVSRGGDNFDGEPKSSYGKVHTALKARAFNTEVHIGDVSPTSPVLYASDIRLLPQTLRGVIFRNTSVTGLTLQGGRLTSSSDRNASAHGGDLGTMYAGRFDESDDVIYVGGDYQVNDQLSFKLHTSKLDDIWNQSFFRVDVTQPVDEQLSLKAGMSYYRTRDEGAALAGEIDNNAWSARVGAQYGAHGFTLAHTRIDGDTPFDYVWNTYDIELDSASQVSDFNNPNERIWLARYDFDFAAVGIPGLSLTARYVSGRDIDGTRATPAYGYFNAVSDGKHWERNFWLSYVVQEGVAKNLSVSILQATHRVGGDHSAEANADELRVIVQFPWQMF